MKHKSVRSLVAALLAVIGTLLPFSAVYAIDAPENSDFVQDVDAFTHLLEKGDLLVITDYRLQYSTIPTDYQSQDAFILQLLNSGDIVGSNTLYPYNENGYNYGVGSVYLDADETNKAGLTDTSGNWTAWGPDTLTTRIVGNPVVWTSAVPSDQRSIISGDFTTAETGSVNENALRTKILEIADNLGARWGVDMIAEDPDVLSGIGARYLPLAIPALFDMVSNLTLISTEPTTYPTPVPSLGAFATASEDQYADVTWIDGAFNSFEADTGIPAGALKGLVITILSMIIIGFAAYHLGNLGALVSFAGLTAVGLPLFVSQGFVPWAIGIFVAAMVSVLGFLKLSGRLET